MAHKLTRREKTITVALVIASAVAIAVIAWAIYFFGYMPKDG